MKNLFLEISAKIHKMDDDLRDTLKYAPVVVAIFMFIVAILWQINHGWAEMNGINFLICTILSITFSFSIFVLISMLLWSFFLFYVFCGMFYRRLQEWAVSPNKK